MGACIKTAAHKRSCAAAVAAAARAALLQVFNQFLMKSKIAIDLFS